MVAKERVVVLMTDRQKAEVVKRAKAAKLSINAYMLRQTFGGDAIIAAVLDELRDSTRHAVAAMDHAVAHCKELEHSRADRESQARRRAKAEFQDLNISAMLD